MSRRQQSARKKQSDQVKISGLRDCLLSGSKSFVEFLSTNVHDNLALRNFGLFLRKYKDESNISNQITIKLKHEQRLDFVILIARALLDDRENVPSLAEIGRNFSSQADPNFKWVDDMLEGFDEAETLISYLKDLFDKDQSVRDYLSNIYRRDEDEVNFHINALMALKDSIVNSRHDDRRYRIDDIDFAATPSSTTVKDVSLLDVFKRHHNIDIKDHMQPLLVCMEKSEDEDKACPEKQEDEDEQGDIRPTFLVPELVVSAYRWVIEQLDLDFAVFKVFREGLHQKEREKWDALVFLYNDKFNEFEDGDLSADELAATNIEELVNIGVASMARSRKPSPSATSENSSVQNTPFPHMNSPSNSRDKSLQRGDSPEGVLLGENLFNFPEGDPVRITGLTPISPTNEDVFEPGVNSYFTAGHPPIFSLAENEKLRKMMAKKARRDNKKEKNVKQVMKAEDMLGYKGNEHTDAILMSLGENPGDAKKGKKKIEKIEDLRTKIERFKNQNRNLDVANDFIEGKSLRAVPKQEKEKSVKSKKKRKNRDAKCKVGNANVNDESLIQGDIIEAQYQESGHKDKGIDIRKKPDTKSKDAERNNCLIQESMFKEFSELELADSIETQQFKSDSESINIVVLKEKEMLNVTKAQVDETKNGLREEPLKNSQINFELTSSHQTGDRLREGQSNNSPLNFKVTSANEESDKSSEPPKAIPVRDPNEVREEVRDRYIKDIVEVNEKIENMKQEIIKNEEMKARELEDLKTKQDAEKLTLDEESGPEKWEVQEEMSRVKKKMAETEAKWDRKKKEMSARHTEQNEAVRKKYKDKESQKTLANLKKASAQLTDDMKKLDIDPNVVKQVDDAREMLECPICMEMMSPPTRIWMCDGSHCVCEKCKSLLPGNQCPTCRSNKVNIRALNMENLARALFKQ